MPINRICYGDQSGENAGSLCYPELCGDLIHWSCYFCHGDLTIYAEPEPQTAYASAAPYASPSSSSYAAPPTSYAPSYAHYAPSYAHYAPTNPTYADDTPDPAGDSRQAWGPGWGTTWGSHRAEADVPQVSQRTQTPLPTKFSHNSRPANTSRDSQDSQNSQESQEARESQGSQDSQDVKGKKKKR
ncbi:hypothetical protein CC85DRAFT_326453 [Cutaneotrichosporon oleaginosum]|uniref:Uncharacterized protein n=1 Tax=Cutaneotrichosporon oleaginosum TaxID=879819 RepID=A0A0J0XU67_9TREE|nr:uncharacterized protein CC85DRAFT_326453 [Cutaneotrichosporon oleaginosum]KLT44610.1 hypothetical protein CC85DRAFT_326453 [Cutaneotrichosporon oleaginosum]